VTDDFKKIVDAHYSVFNALGRFCETSEAPFWYQYLDFFSVIDTIIEVFILNKQKAI
jgi:hypothetical protein